MKTPRLSLCLFLVFSVLAPVAGTGWAGKLTGMESKAKISESTMNLPLTFMENRGQLDERIKFYEKGLGHETFFTEEGIFFSFYEHKGKPRSIPEKLGDDAEREKLVAVNVVKLSPVGGGGSVRVLPADPLEGKVNSYMGNDRTRWKTGIPTYGTVVYQEALPGVDLKFYGTNRQFEYDIVLKPGVDPSQVNLRYTGIEGLSVTDKGDLAVRVREGLTFRQKKPVVYQVIEGRRVECLGSFRIQGTDGRTPHRKDTSAEEVQHAVIPASDLQQGSGYEYTYGFEVSSYDKRHPLIIDPVIVYSDYLDIKGSGEEYGIDIAVDSFGSAYITGYTWSTSTGFLALNPLQASMASGNYTIYVKKLNAAGAELYTSYLGGDDDSYSLSIALDASRNAYITGYTLATDFPVEGPFQSSNAGSSDAFVVKFNSSLGLVYATYLGGSQSDSGRGIAVDTDGKAYVVGRTRSTNFPMQDAYQSTHSSGDVDAFVSKLNEDGDALEYSTFLGGNSDNFGEAVAVDASGYAYVTGWTFSTNFPRLNPVQSSIGGISDAFVTKLNTNGESLVYSTYLGGSEGDSAHSIVVNSSGNAFIVGETDSSNFPTSSAVQSVFAGITDAFVAKLSSAGSSLLYSTYLGGSDSDSGYAIALDSSGNAYVTGRTSSSNFPMVSAFQGTKDSYGAAFVTKLNTAGSALTYSSYFLGNTGSDCGKGIAVDSSGNAYITGYTEYSGDRNAFVAKIGGTSGAGITVVSPNGGEMLQGGGSKVISWTYTGSPGATVKIDLYKGGDLKQAIVASTSIGSGGTGSYTWETIPASLSSGSDYKVRVASTSNSAYRDFSDHFFSISKPPPAADFSGTPQTGALPLTVAFTDLSTGNPTSWRWEFGDGGTSTAQNPSHTYKTMGPFDVTLTATGSGGSNSVKKIAYITTTAEPPTADFTASPTSGQLPLTVNFTDKSTGSITSWSWDFGNFVLTTRNPSVIWSWPGTYTVTLTVTGPGGTDSKTRTDYITVVDPPLTVTAPNGGESWRAGTAQTIRWTYTENAGDSVKIDLYKDSSLLRTIVASTPVGSGGSGAYSWIIPSSLTPAADYKVRISSTTTPGYKDFSNAAFTITAKANTADFSGTPTSGLSPLTVAFTDGSSSGITTWSWFFGDGGTSSDRNPSHTYTAPGKYTVTLVAQNSSGYDSMTKTDYITVHGITVTAPNGGEVWPAGKTRTIRWNYSGNPGNTVKIELYKGSSSVVIMATSASIGSSGTGSYSWTISPNRPASDDYRVRVSSTTNTACKDLSDAVFTITEAPPVANFTASPTTGVMPLTVDFTDTSTGSVTTRLWDFGDGHTSTQQNPSHEYTDAGSYTVTLGVAGPGGSDNKIKSSYITVKPPPSVNIVTPNGGQSLQAGSTQALRWSYLGSAGSTVKIELLRGATIVHTITSSVSIGSGGDGVYSWTIPSTQTPADNYRIKVTSDTGTNDTSTNPFTITESAPVANFIATPTTGSAPLTVKFTNTSRGVITSRSWDFGDGSEAGTTNNPSHTYDTPGTYTVVLAVTGPGGSDTKTRTAYIVINDYAPVANFTGTPTTGNYPLTVAFTDSSTGTITDRFWEFGDGSTSTATSPSYTYTAAGTHTVRLTVNGPGGTDTKTRTDYITVTDPPPEAHFTGTPTTGTAPLTVVFTQVAPFGGPATAWLWDFGDGSTSTAPSPSHVYSTPGSYTVVLTLTGPGGNSTVTGAGYIVVSYPPPVAGFTGTPRTGTAPLSVAFTNTSSGNITGYSWNFGDGSAASTETSPSHTYTNSGTYTVTLTATGPGGSNTATSTNYVTVSASPPNAEFAGTPTSGTAPLAVQFTDASSAGGGTITARSWNFGDGGTSTATSPSHIYTTPGTYTVRLSVTATGGSNTETKTGYITVNYPAPVAEFTGSPTTGVAPYAVTFTNASTGTITSRSWDFGDGGTSTSTSPSHTYSTPGTYTVTLTVYGPGGTSSRVRTDYIVVNYPAPVAGFTASPSSGAASLTTQFTDTSTGNITSWAWTFGDGGTSTVQSPSHVYTTPGTYTVVLIVSGPGGSNTRTRSNLITVNNPTITVTSPNGGETWSRSTTRTITWSYTGTPGATVSIELYNNGNFASTITAGTSIGSGGTGSYTWAIPSGTTTATKYKVKITSTTNSAYTDRSNNNFTIN